MSFAGSPPASPTSTEPDDCPRPLHSYHHPHHHHNHDAGKEDADKDEDEDEEGDERMGAESDEYDTEVDSPASPPPRPYDGQGDEEGSSEMAMDLDTVHGQLEKLELSDTDMDDSDSDSNFSADSSESEDLSSLSGGDDDDELGDVQIGDDYFAGAQPPLSPGGSIGSNRPGPAAAAAVAVAVAVAVVPPPPHFTSPQYETWLAAQTPNVAFQIRIKPLISGSMIAAHSIRLWYRDFANRAAFLARIVDEYQLMADDICGFVVKERRSHVWVQFGTDEPCWHAVLGRIRHRLADENFPGTAVAVRAELKVLVGGGPLPLQGQIVDKGVFRPGGGDNDDPDL